MWPDTQVKITCTTSTSMARTVVEPASIMARPTPHPILTGRRCGNREGRHLPRSFLFHSRQLHQSEKTPCSCTIAPASKRKCHHKYLSCTDASNFMMNQLIITITTQHRPLSGAEDILPRTTALRWPTARVPTPETASNRRTSQEQSLTLIFGLMENNNPQSQQLCWISTCRKMSGFGDSKWQEPRSAAMTAKSPQHHWPTIDHARTCRAAT